jgi:hypothetical protein
MRTPGTTISDLNIYLHSGVPHALSTFLPSTRWVGPCDGDIEYFVRLSADLQPELLSRIVLTDRKLHIVH